MTLILSGTNGVSDIDGDASTPAIRGTDANTGIFFGSDVIGFSEGGTECARFNADAQFVAAAGTASLPVLTTTGDLNTGIFFPAADTIAFAEGGAEAMRIDASGRVGINVTNPAQRLHISGFQLFENNNEIRFKDSGGTERTAIILDSSNNLSIGTSANGNLRFINGSTYTERMRIDSSGNVGIGTSSPSSILHLSSTLPIITLTDTTQTSSSRIYQDEEQLAIDADPANAIAGTYIAFRTDNTERARITSGGYFKASDSGTYNNSTGAWHELRQTQNQPCVLITATNASFTDTALQIYPTRNTSNGTYNLIAGGVTGVGTRFVVADSGNVTNTNGSYGTISDIKFKKDIVDAASQWDDIKNIRIRKFRLKDDPEQVLQIGVIAQEVEEVSPGLVEDHRETKQVTKTREVEKTREVTPAVLDEDGNEIEPAVTETYIDTEEYQEFEDTGETYKTFKASVLYMKAVKALQEAMERIEVLEAEVAALKGQ